jgi:hypothetical protein
MDGYIRSTAALVEPAMLELRVVARAVPAACFVSGGAAPMPIRPLRDGAGYVIRSPEAEPRAAAPIAFALEAVLERFAVQRGFDRDRPLVVGVIRGFETGSHGHGLGRAVDIGSVGGVSLGEWKRRWDRAVHHALRVGDRVTRERVLAAERRHNLGHALYSTLLQVGGWLTDPNAWRPYRDVPQLFGPWTPTLGPWRPLSRSVARVDPQRLADQRWVYRAHEDHIHVAR